MSSLSPEARGLLDTVRTAGGPSALQRSAMKQAVLAAVLLPATAAAGSAIGTAKATGLALAAKLGLVVASVGVGAALIWQLASPAVVLPEPLVKAPAVVEAPAVTPSTPPSPPVVAAAPEAAPRPAPARAVRAAALPGVKEAPPVIQEAPAPAPAAVVDEATLSREIAALSGAMGAVDSKTYAVALEQLSSYRAAFPAGLLETEARVLEVLALCGLGRVEAARAAAGPLPVNNPAVRRLERSCIAPGNSR